MPETLPLLGHHLRNIYWGLKLGSQSAAEKAILKAREEGSSYYRDIVGTQLTPGPSDQLTMPETEAISRFTAVLDRYLLSGQSLISLVTNPPDLFCGQATVHQVHCKLVNPGKEKKIITIFMQAINNPVNWTYSQEQFDQSSIPQQAIIEFLQTFSVLSINCLVL